MSSANDWPMVKLGEVATFIRGVTFKPDDKVGPEDGVPVMRTKNVQASLDLSDVIRIPANLVKNDRYLRTGDTLVSTANSWNLVGKCCWIPELAEPTAIGGFVSALRTTSEHLLPRYLYSWFNSSRIQTTVRSFSNQTTNISNLSVKRCLDLKIPLPPLAEQQRLTEILDLVSTSIRHSESQLSLLASLAMSYTTSCLESDVTAPLSDFGSFSGGMTPNKKNSEYWDGEVRWFTTKDLKKPVLADSIDHVTEQALAGTSLKLIDTPSIAFSLRGMSLAHTVPMSRIPADSAVNQDLKAFVPHNPDAIGVLYALIKAKTPWLLSKVSTSGHGTKKLDFTHLQNLELPVLSEDEFSKFDHALAHIEELERKKAQELEVLQALHHSLSTRAFASQL